MPRKTEKKIWVPSLDSEKFVLDPAVNFLDDDIYIGLRIRAREVNTEELQKQVWFLTSKGLVPKERLEEDSGYFLERPLTYHKLRPSKEILTSKNIPELEVKFMQLFSNKTQVIKNKKNYIYGFYKKITTETTPLSTKIWKTNKEITTLTTQLFDFLMSKIAYFFDFEDRNYTIITALWIFGTYFHRLFSAYPYLFVTGVKRSGKTSILNFINYTSFNPMLCGALTPSSMFRFIDGAAPTLLIDDQDWLANYKQNRGELMDLLKNGYKKGDMVLRSERTSDKERFLPIEYYTYSPKAISNIKGMDDILEDRCITIVMERAIDKKFGDRVANMEYDKDWQDIVDAFYVCMFCNYKEIGETYETLENKTKLLNRDWELWKPLLAIAKYISDDLYDVAVEIAKKETEAKAVESMNESELNMLQSLRELVQERRYYKVSEIKKKMLEKYEETPKFLNNWWVGRAMKRYGFKDSRRVGCGIEYYMTCEIIDKKFKRLGITYTDEEPEEIKKEQWVDTTKGEHDGMS